MTDGWLEDLINVVDVDLFANDVLSVDSVSLDHFAAALFRRLKLFLLAVLVVRVGARSFYW